MKQASPSKKQPANGKRTVKAVKRASPASPAKQTKAVKRATKLKEPEGWVLRLYVAGQTPKSLTAFANLKRLCEEHMTETYTLEVIDLVQNPQLAASHQIVALPTLVRQLPAPIKRVVGDLSNIDRVLVGMDLCARAK